MISSVPPLFAAKEAVHSLYESKKSQTILILGESGSGKTESTKRIVDFLCKPSYISAISETQRVLETFGNATTIENNNSSRFTKVVGIHYDKNMKVIGGTVRTCLLESNRVCFQNVGESNFHVFSLLLFGAPQDMKDELHLGHEHYNVSDLK